MKNVIAMGIFGLMAVTAVAQTPLDPARAKPSTMTPFNQASISPGVILLMELDGRFSQEVAKGGGKVFASWFAPDGLTLNNKHAPVMGKTRVTATANWDPKEYQLTWIPQGGQMGPSNDMGFTWGHYEGHSKDRNGQPVVLEGRYITVWVKLPSGEWKVALDASAEEPPQAGECCALPKP
jgi:ketosteroid isomerase-like protein